MNFLSFPCREETSGGDIFDLLHFAGGPGDFEGSESFGFADSEVHGAGVLGGKTTSALVFGAEDFLSDGRGDNATVAVPVGLMGFVIVMIGSLEANENGVSF